MIWLIVALVSALLAGICFGLALMSTDRFAGWYWGLVYPERFWRAP